MEANNMRSQAPSSGPFTNGAAPVPDRLRPSANEGEVQQPVEPVNVESVCFDYVPEINRMIVQVKDGTSGEVIREIPSKGFVRQQLAIREMIGRLLDRQA